MTLSFTCEQRSRTVVLRCVRSDLEHVRNLAFEDSEWKAINQRVDTFYVVEGLPEPICSAFMPSLAPGEGPPSRSWGYARAEHLLELRNFVGTHPLAPANRIVAWAGTVLEKEARMIRLLEERERKKRRRTKEGDEGSHDPTDGTPNEAASGSRSRAATPEPENFILVTPKRTAEELVRSSPVADTKVVRSTSSKLNYILKEVS
jgi:hypothetical protein